MLAGNSSIILEMGLEILQNFFTNCMQEAESMFTDNTIIRILVCNSLSLSCTFQVKADCACHLQFS